MLYVLLSLAGTQQQCFNDNCCVYINVVYSTLANCCRLEKMLKGEMFSAAELFVIGTFMDLALKEASTLTEVCALEPNK